MRIGVVLRLAKRTGLAVGRADIDVLVERGLLAAAGEFNGWPIYGLDAIDAVSAEVLAEVVEERIAWLGASVDDRTAAAVLGLRRPELLAWTAARGVEAGRFGRYARADVESCAAADDRADQTALWARRMLGPGVAVLLDTETADLGGAVCEIAVVDVTTGEALLDTLVDPGVPISEAARRVHGIDDDAVAGAPGWPDVLPVLLRATDGRSVVAYNAGYDSGVIRAECERHGLDPRHLGDERGWECLMTRRGARLPLGGPHRALADCRVALNVLRGLAGTGVRRWGGR